MPLEDETTGPITYATKAQITLDNIEIVGGPSEVKQLGYIRAIAYALTSLALRLEEE